MRHTDVHLVERNGTIQNWFEMYQPTDQTPMCLKSRQPIRLNIQRLVVKTEEINMRGEDHQPHQQNEDMEHAYREYDGQRNGRSVFTVFLSALCLLAIGCANADSVSESSGNTVDALVSTGIDVIIKVGVGVPSTPWCLDCLIDRPLDIRGRELLVSIQEVPDVRVEEVLLRVHERRGELVERRVAAQLVHRNRRLVQHGALRVPGLDLVVADHLELFAVVRAHLLDQGLVRLGAERARVVQPHPERDLGGLAPGEHAAELPARERWSHEDRRGVRAGAGGASGAAGDRETRAR